MSMPSNSSLSNKLGITIAETMTWEMKHYGTMDHADGDFSVVFSIPESTMVELEGTLDRYDWWPMDYQSEPSQFSCVGQAHSSPKEMTALLSTTLQK
jgi:hypothetical protein